MVSLVPGVSILRLTYPASELVCEFVGDRIGDKPWRCGYWMSLLS